MRYANDNRTHAAERDIPAPRSGLTVYMVRGRYADAIRRLRPRYRAVLAS